MALIDERDFSNWLKENIEVLNRLVLWDIDPASVEREKHVTRKGRRRYVDLLCKATERDSDMPFYVVIENQLTTTDNKHLARIMQYISAFDAFSGIAPTPYNLNADGSIPAFDVKGLVWIAGNTRAEHAQVVHWLNHNTEMDAYIFNLDKRDIPDLIPVVYPGMQSPDIENVPRPQPMSKRGSNADKASSWFKRVLPRVKYVCESLGVWQTQSTIKPAYDHIFSLQLPVLHRDRRVSDYLSWYIEVHPSFARIGLHIPKKPRHKSHYYFESFTSHWITDSTNIDIIPNNSVGYECTDEVALEAEASEIERDIAGLIGATKDIIFALISYEESNADW